MCPKVYVKVYHADLALARIFVKFEICCGQIFFVIGFRGVITIYGNKFRAIIKK